MNVQEVMVLAKEWVVSYPSQIPGFVGAHLLGALNYLPHTSTFPPYRDIDIQLVFDAAPASSIHDVLFKGYLIEYGIGNADTYRSAEAVLASPMLASNLAVNSILADPTGILTAVSSTIATEYNRRIWVTARCRDQKSRVTQSLDALGHATNAFDVMAQLYATTTVLCGLIACASLMPPTNRRCLINLKQVLERHGRRDLHDDLMTSLGYDRISRAMADTYLRDCAAAFDVAVQVVSTPVPAAYKLHDYVRPYIVEGSQEMLDEGHYQEAMIWIGAFLMLSNLVIQNDGTASDKQLFRSRADRLLIDLGWNTPARWKVGTRRVRKQATELFDLAEDIMQRSQAIAD